MGSVDVKPKSLLEVVESICNVDVDAVDAKVATSLPFKAHNQTSNQVICYNTMVQPEYRELFEDKLKTYGSQGWEEVFNRVSVEFCAINIRNNNITGRALVQISPSRVYDTQKVLEQAYAYDRAFAEAGVSRDRYAVKISTTGSAMVAAKKLNSEGIRTLGTSLFSVEQAVAASQAGCLFISPYFNEVAAYSDDSLLYHGPDPAINHPMAPRVIHILEAYTKLYEQTGKEQPLFVMASNANIGEVLATAELGCQHITILAHHLQELRDTPFDDAAIAKYPALKNLPTKKTAPYYRNLVTPDRFKGHSTADPLAGSDWNGKIPSIDVDYLKDGGRPLSEAMEKDPAVVRKMKDVLNAFDEADQKAKKTIEEELAKL